MTRKDVICLAEKAGWTGPKENVTYVAMLERFANLIAEANDNKYPIKFTHEEYNAVIQAALAYGAAEEREACAMLAEERLLDKANCTAEQMYELQKKSIAAAIRARGQE